MSDANRLALNLTGTVVALLVVSLFGGAIFALVKFDVPQANQNALLVLLGALTSQVSNIVAFFFGSSSSDKSKNDTISKLTETNAAQTLTISPASGPTAVIEPGQTATVAAKDTAGA